MSASKNLIQASAGVGGGDFYPYTVDYSARFNDVDSAYLYTTLSTATDSKVFCVSTWLKRGDLGEYSQFFGAGVDAFNRFGMRFDSSDRLEVFTVTASTDVDNIRTTRVFRDPSAWMHIFFVQDTTEGTASDRWKIFINGVQETSFDTTNYPTSNATTYANAAYVHYIGTDGSINYFYSGYQSEVVMIDGTAYAPTDFAEDKNGIWIPKDPSGLTFGTNGFYLDFSNSGALGTDVSGNGNNFTTSGLAAYDQMPDTPTNNFATMNPLESGLGCSNGNLVQSSGSSAWRINKSTIYFNVEEDWYFEARLSGSGSDKGMIGISVNEHSINTYFGNGAEAYGYNMTTGGKYSEGAGNVAYGSTAVSGDIIGVHISGGSLTFYKNGVSQGVAYSGLTGYMTPSFAQYLGYTWTANFGQNGTFNGAITAGGNTDANGLGDFKYTVPTDALALCTANLPEPTIGPTSTIKPDEVFAPILYTGNGTSQSISTLEFQPDFTWIKNRDATDNHMLFDAVRGATKYLNSNTTNAEATDAQSLSSFNSNGFSVGNNVAVNTNTEDYVAWNWKGNGSGVTNNDGSITSTVSANQNAGISIVNCTAPASGDFTVGHGLGKTPDVIIARDRETNGTAFAVWHSAVTTGVRDYLLLNTAAAMVTQPTTNVWGSSVPNSTVFGMTAGSIMVGGKQTIAWCFAGVEGFSSFGSYTGNGSATDGPFIYTGFRPAFVLYKRTDASSSWILLDSSRNTYNVADKYLLPDSANAEASFTLIDMVSNGFKIRTSDGSTNQNTGTYIYMAFAENPFKYSNAR